MCLKRCAAILLALAFFCSAAMSEEIAWTQLIEYQLTWHEFSPMPEAALTEFTGELGEIADAYAFTGRVSADGAYGYIIGVCTAQASPLAGMQESIYNTPDGGQMRGLWPEDADLWAADAPPPAYAYEGVQLIFRADTPETIILLPDTYAAHPYRALYHALIAGETAAIADATARGVSVCAPPAPYLFVHHFTDGAPHEEYIRLTQDDLQNAMLSSYHYTPEEIGDFSLVVIAEEGLDLYEQAGAGISAPMLQLAQERCDFTIAAPADIGEIVSAHLEAKFYDGTLTQTVDDPALLAELGEILKNAKYEGLYGCPYTGVLTLTMADGREMVIHKATDSCDTLIFGSAAGYTIGRKQNARFWEIFSDIPIDAP